MLRSDSIVSLWFRFNEDDGTYSIDIETKGIEINFPRAKVQFLCGEYIAFPVNITTLDENMNKIDTYSITANDSHSIQEHENGEGNS